MADRPFNVLFLCTGNSARSIMAEAILNRAGQGRFQAFSAGSHPKGQVHPYAIDLLKKLNYDVSKMRSKSWLEFSTTDAPKLDFVEQPFGKSGLAFTNSGRLIRDLVIDWIKKKKVLD